MNRETIAIKLASDRKFRDEFFVNPRDALSNAGLLATEDEIQAFEKFDWSSLHFSESSFCEEEIMRCSVSY
ncbi:hypothetical protein ACFLRW_02155 [Acidobacteriota bacterium]